MMALPRMHDDREFCLFHNGKGQHVGSNAIEVRDWLDAHPDYIGGIYGDWDTGGSRDNFDATEMFFDCDEETGELTRKVDRIEEMAS